MIRLEKAYSAGVRLAMLSILSELVLLQLGVLRLGLLQDGNVGVGVFPKREEIFVGGKPPHASGIGIRTLRGLRLQSVRPSHSQMRQSSRPAIPDDPAVVENLLKLGGSTALSGCQVCLAAYVNVIETGNIGDERNPPTRWGSSLQSIQGGSPDLREPASKPLPLPVALPRRCRKRLVAERHSPANRPIFLAVRPDSGVQSPLG